MNSFTRSGLDPSWSVNSFLKLGLRSKAWSVARFGECGQAFSRVSISRSSRCRSGALESKRPGLNRSSLSLSNAGRTQRHGDSSQITAIQQQANSPSTKPLFRFACGPKLAITAGILSQSAISLPFLDAQGQGVCCKETKSEVVRVELSVVSPATVLGNCIPESCCQDTQHQASEKRL